MYTTICFQRGIPQGSVYRAPTILNAYTNINLEIVDSTGSCFADDTRIRLGIKDDEDAQMLQND